MPITETKISIPWADIEGSERYKSLNPSQKTTVKLGWFEEHIGYAPEFKGLSSDDKVRTLEGFFNEKPEDIDLTDEMGKGFVRGGLGILESIGIGFEYLGNRLPTSDFSKKLSDFGKERAATYKAEAEKYPQPESIAGKNVIDNPELLGNAAWWVSNVSEMVPTLVATMVPGGAGYKIAKGVGTAANWTPRVIANMARLSAAVFGGATGGGLEGSQTYKAVIEEGGSEQEAARAGELMAMSSGLLNALSVGNMFGQIGTGFMGVAKKAGLSAVVEGLTEGAEEPAEVASKLLSKYLNDEPMPEDIKGMFIESLKSAATVAPIAGVTGLAGGAVGGTVAPQEGIDIAQVAEDLEQEVPTKQPVEKVEAEQKQPVEKPTITPPKTMGQQIDSMFERMVELENKLKEQPAKPAPEAEKVEARKAEGAVTREELLAPEKTAQQLIEEGKQIDLEGKITEPTPKPLKEVDKPKKEALKEVEPKLSKEIEPVYQTVINEIPEKYRDGITVESVKVGKFPDENEGEGGRLIRLKSGNHAVVLEKGIEDIAGVLKHELIHSYVENHPEMSKPKDSKDVHYIERAVDGILEEIEPKAKEPWDGKERREFYGVRDKVERGVMSVEDARAGKKPPTEPIASNRLTANAADLAADYKAKGIERQATYSQFVRDRALKPEIDAKEFYAIYDSVAPLLYKDTAKPTPEAKKPAVEAMRESEPIKEPEIELLISQLEQAGLKTDADNIRRSWDRYSKSDDKTMMEGTIDTAKLILKQEPEIEVTEESSIASERWDSAKLGVRVEWAMRGAWVTKKGKLTGLGAKIAESRWEELSPAAKNVVTRIIKEDYPHKFKAEIEVTDKGEETEVKVDIPKVEAESLTPKEQKAYLLAEIDKAIDKHVKDGIKGHNLKEAGTTFDRIREHFISGDVAFGSGDQYTFKVPADGEFKIWGNGLVQFAKNAKQFPSGKFKAPKLKSTEQISVAKLRKDYKELEEETEGKPKTKSQIIKTVKSESGEAQIIADLSEFGVDLVRKGYDKYTSFRKEMRRQLSEIWDKIKHLIRRIFNSAKQVIANERGAIDIEIPGKPEKSEGEKQFDEIIEKHTPAEEHAEKMPTFIKEMFGAEPKTWKQYAISVAKAVKQGKYSEVVSQAKQAGVGYWLKTNLLDKLHPIKVLLNDRIWKLHTGLSGTHMTAGAFFQDGVIEWDKSGLPIVKTKDQGPIPYLKNLGKDWYKFPYWLAAKRAEMLSKPSEKHPKGRELWLTEEKRDKIFEWTGGSDNAKYIEAANKIDEFNNSVLNFAQKAGIINPDGRKLWESEYYIPFYRIFENADTREEYLKAPHKNNKFISAQIKKLRGADRKLGDPFQNMLHNWMYLINESMRNVAREEAFEFGRQFEGDAEASVIEEVPKKDMAHYTTVKDKDSNRITYVHPVTGENVLMFQREGKPVYFKTYDVPLFNALGGMNAVQMDNFIFKMLAKAKKWLTYGATFGPAFRVANALRDTIQASLMNKSFMPLIDSAKGVVKAWNKSPEYVALMASGMGFGSRYVQESPEATAKHIKRLIKSEGHGAVDRILNTPRRMLEFWDKIGAVSEVAARVQLYSNLMGKGATHLDSAFEARDLLDFSRSGASKEVQMLIQITPFLNARMQGLDKVVRSAKDPANRKNFVLRGSMLMMASMALWALNKDDDRYKELEDWDKWTYHHFWIGDLHYRIPRAFEVGALFTSLPETILDTLYGNNETKHIADFISHTATETFAIGAPQLFKPVIEQWANKSFFTGRPIIGERLKGLTPSEQKEPWTSETMQLIGKALNISPKRAEKVVQGYFSTFGAFLLGSADLLAQNMADFPTQPTRRIDDYPLLGRFFRRGEPARYTRQQTWFYDYNNELDEFVKTVNHYKAIGDYDKARKLATNNREKIKLKKRFNKVRTRISKLNRRTRKILMSKTMSPSEKAKRTDELIRRKNDLIMNVYKKYK